MTIAKSSHYAKVLGDHSEALVCKALSRSGFEAAVIDHTGIDIIAYDRATKKLRLGITVKARTRMPGTENEVVTLFKGNDRQKVTEACEGWNLEPWIAVYVETEDHGDLFLTSLKNYDAKYARVTSVQDGWRMSDAARKAYEADPDVKHFFMSFVEKHWWP